MDMKNVLRQSAQYLLTRDKTKYAHSETNPLFDMVSTLH